ncbi:diguanylate cyclase domain-containing protein [Anaerosolibacter sp.]|uniref:diguanylate cyclase domain-containing protein n=1 Tax=Anaerosolibacter sp. TaxID=1872527 RepID=UPI0039F0CEDE
MIDRVYEISIKDPIYIHPEDGISKVKNIALTNKVYYFPVVENNKLVGVLTLNDLLTAHSNRIIADVITNRYDLIPHDDYLWIAKNKFLDTGAEVLVVMKDENIIGMLTESQVDIALGRHVDPLTGLYKKSYIHCFANELIHENSELSFIFIDINNFGLIDKNYGHIIGDKLLQQIANLLKEVIPKDTYLCRYAGDEFLILTPFLLDEAVLLAKRIIHTIRNYTFINDIDMSIAAGISGGRRLNNRNHSMNDNVKSLINLASLASTKAKRDNCDYHIADKITVYETEEMII